MSGALSSLFGKPPKMPKPSPPPVKVDEAQAISARDDLLKKMAKLRRATVTSELSAPNVRRKELGAGT